MTDLGASGAAPDPKLERFRPVVRSVRVALVIAAVLAAAAVVVPGDAGHAAADGAIVVVLAAPVARVIWLAQRWFRRGDRRYGGVAVGVLGVIAAAVVVAALT